MIDQTEIDAFSEELCTYVEARFPDLSAQKKRALFLLCASELVAAAANAVSVEAPGMPVVELILLSDRIANLADPSSLSPNE